MVWPELKFEPQAIDPRGTPRAPDAIGFEREVYDFYRSAIALRKKQAALRRGDFRVAGNFDDEQVFAFQRRLGMENLLVVLNRSEQPREVRIALAAVDSAKFAGAKVIFSTDSHPQNTTLRFASGTLTVKIPALTGAVIAP